MEPEDVDEQLEGKYSKESVDAYLKQVREDERKRLQLEKVKKELKIKEERIREEERRKTLTTKEKLKEGVNKLIKFVKVPTTTNNNSSKTTGYLQRQEKRMVKEPRRIKYKKGKKVIYVKPKKKEPKSFFGTGLSVKWE